MNLLKEELDTINPYKILNFFKSNLGIRILEANEIGKKGL